MVKEPSHSTNDLSAALDLLSAAQIAALVFGSYTLFGDLHLRAQPRPRDRAVSRQLRVVNADGADIRRGLLRLAEYDPVKALAVAAYLKDTSHTFGASDLARRLETAVKVRDTA